MAETKTINLDVKSNIGSLRAQLAAAQREVYQMSEAYGATSEQAAQAAIKTAQLKDAIADAKNLTDAFNPDAKFNSLSNSIGGVLNGFQAYEGAMALLGVESESLQKTMLKVQSAMALSQGLQGLFEAKDSFIQLGAVAKNALSGIRAGIAATGIGLFVVALGTIVAYWDDIKAAVNGVTTEQEKLNAKTDANLAAQEAKYSSLVGQENILKLQGKSEREILLMKQDAIKAVIKETKARLIQQEATKKAQIEAEKRNYDNLKLVSKIGLETSVMAFRALAAPIDAVLETANAVADALGFDKITTTNLNKEISKLTETASETLTKFIFDPKAVEDEGKKTIEETKKKLEALENEKAGYELSIKEIDNKALEDKKKNADEAAKAEDEAKKKQLEIIKQANQNRIAAENELNQRLEDIAEQNYLNSLSDSEREIRLIQDKYFELETLAQGNADALKEIEIAKLNEINDVNLKYQEIEYKAREDKKKADQEAAQKELDAAKAVAEQKAAIQQQGLDTALQGIQLIKGLFEKSKGVQKAAVIAESAIGIAKMVIANKLANAGALATPQAIATSGLSAAPVIAMNNISTGIGIAANIAATAKALQALGGGSAPSAGGVGSGGGAGVGGSMSPSFNVVGNSGMNQLAQIQQTPIQAYVVSGEVTSAQALDRNRIKNATL